MSKAKQERIADQIQMILSEVLIRQVRDPRVQGVTITSVDIDRELQYANVYVNALGDDSRQRQEEVLAGLASAAGYLRREVAQRLQLRAAPTLRYQWDPRLAYIEEVNELLADLDIPPEEPQDDAAAAADVE